MKKIIFIGTAILFSSLLVKETCGQKIVSNKSDAGSTFGRYGDCTTGRGICGIGADNLDSKSSTAKFIVEKENDSTIVLKIFKNKISSIEEVNLFEKSRTNLKKNEVIYFKMDVDLPIENAVKTGLGLQAKNFKIGSGYYLTVQYDSYYMIELKLK